MEPKLNKLRQALNDLIERASDRNQRCCCHQRCSEKTEKYIDAGRKVAERHADLLKELAKNDKDTEDTFLQVAECVKMLVKNQPKRSIDDIYDVLCSINQKLEILAIKEIE